MFSFPLVTHNSSKLFSVHNIDSNSKLTVQEHTNLSEALVLRYCLNSGLHLSVSCRIFSVKSTAAKCSGNTYTWM